MGFSVVHSTWDNPEGFGYVFDNFQADTNFVNQKTPISFHGHTHLPVIYMRDSGAGGVKCYEAQDFKIEPGKKYFINVGSVGQPRDGNPRSSYVIFHQAEKVVRFRRLEYDIESAQRRILEAGLPERLAYRLGTGE
jgi:diadenosine tetraphosphatase ApaH/serine/threonine PP2A family protein phosphatase